MRIPTILATAVLVVTAAGAGAAPLPDAHVTDADGALATTPELREVFSPDGTIARLEMEVPVGQPMTDAELSDAAGDVIALHTGGPSDNRYDLVIMGDGYTAEEMDLFHAHAAVHWAAIRDTEPFTDYVDFFNVWLVNVHSNESGVDNDPNPTVSKDTALDMYFYCSGVERGLCVDSAKADQMAALAPEADQLLVLANSTKYGGIGGRVATASGGNALSALIAVHELGHSLGGLADEYDYYLRAGLEDDAARDVTIPAPFLYYVGGEPSGVNTTAHATPQSMADAEDKWWRWLGETDLNGDVTGTFEGSGYYRYNQFRPSQDSLMHTLGSPEEPNALNLPSIEKMIAEFYEVVSPIEATTPAPGSELTPGDTVSLQLIGPRSHPLTITWSLDGQPLPELDGLTTVDVTEALAAGSELTATVADETGAVRDPGYLTERLTRTTGWSV